MLDPALVNQFRQDRETLAVFVEGTTDRDVYLPLFRSASRVSGKRAFSLLSVYAIGERSDIEAKFFADTSRAERDEWAKGGHYRYIVNCLKAEDNRCTAIGIIDRDLVNEANYDERQAPNVVLTETRDLETLLLYLSPSSFKDVFIENGVGFPLLVQSFYSAALVGLFVNSENSKQVLATFEDYALNRAAFYQASLYRDDGSRNHLPYSAFISLLNSPNPDAFFDKWFDSVVDLVGNDWSNEAYETVKATIRESMIDEGDGPIALKQRKGNSPCLENKQNLSLNPADARLALGDPLSKRQALLPYFRLARGHNLMAPLLAEVAKKNPGADCAKLPQAIAKMIEERPEEARSFALTEMSQKIENLVQAFLAERTAKEKN